MNNLGEPNNSNSSQVEDLFEQNRRDIFISYSSSDSAINMTVYAWVTLRYK